MTDIKTLIGNETEFPILRQWHFFNHAGVSPLPRAAGEALSTFAQQAQSSAHLDWNWYADIERLRKSAGRLINASPGEIAFVRNTSEGLATVAAGIDFRPGDRIVTTGVEYPANIYPWMAAARRSGAELVMIAEETGPDGARRVPLERILAEAAHPRTRLVTLSHVEYASGQRHDLAAIGAFCREHGKLFCVDAIQSLGALPVDVRAMNIDYLSADGHKWLLGPEGAGIFYCRPELLERMAPLVIGWMNVRNAEDYGQYDFTLKGDARRFEAGSHNVAGLLSLRASLDMLLDVGIDAVANRLHYLTLYLVNALVHKGYQVLSPRGEGEWSGIVSFASPGGDHGDIVRRLRKEHHVEIAVREGRLRCSPHFYNTQAQLDALVEGLEEVRG